MNTRRDSKLLTVLDAGMAKTVADLQEWASKFGRPFTVHAVSTGTTTVRVSEPEADEPTAVGG